MMKRLLALLLALVFCLNTFTVAFAAEPTTQIGRAHV